MKAVRFVREDVRDPRRVHFVRGGRRQVDDHHPRPDGDQEKVEVLAPLRHPFCTFSWDSPG